MSVISWEADIPPQAFDLHSMPRADIHRSKLVRKLCNLLDQFIGGGKQ
jgi:hypothetical protein